MKQFKYVAAMMLVVAILGSAAITYAAEGDSPPGRAHRPRGVAGEVTAVSDNSLTLVTRAEETVNVNVSADTVVFLMATQTEGSLSDIAVGDHVNVHGRPSEEGTVEAVRINVAPAGDRAGGRVTAVDGQSITVENRAGEAINIITNANTTFWIGPEEQGSLADVTAGKFVNAYGELQDGSLSANVVFVRERPPHGPGGPGGPRPGLRGQGDGRPDVANQ